MPADISFLIPGGALQGPVFARLLEEREKLATLPPGTVVGNYRIVDVLGRGGASVVYRAERNDGTFAQAVALKVVRPDPRLRDYLKRERNILGQLGHPGIARIFDGGETKDGEPWYAMELINGRRIDLWCAFPRADWRECVRLLIAVCEAVQYAHTHLVVHSDLKPSNIVVSTDGFPRLLDFGISRELREPPFDNGITFTPGFASPEQMNGELTTAASDIYQLGRILEVLLDPTGGAQGVHGLDERNLHSVIRRATAQDPQARYTSAAGLRADLVRVRDRYAASAMRGRWRDHAGFFLRRHALLAGVLTLSLIVVAGLVARYLFDIRAERDRTEQEAHHALITNEVLANMFRSASPSAEIASNMKATDLLERSVANTLRRFADAPQQRAIAVESLALAHLDLGDRTKARELIDTAQNRRA